MKQDITPEDERRAYEVLGVRFGFPAAYIKSLLEAHFETPSTAGIEHVQQGAQAQAQAEIDNLDSWTLDDIRRFLASLEKLRMQGLLPPYVREIAMNRWKRDKQGKVYYASNEQLQEEWDLQQRLSIDPDGNLVKKDGTVVKYRWLQSFETKE